MLQFSFYFLQKRVRSLSAALTFTQTGWTNWPNALDSSKGFQQHERSEPHRNSFARWMEVGKIQEGKEKNIIEGICPEMEGKSRENREYLRCLFKYILWLETNEVPKRAHDETDESLNGKWVLSFACSWKQISRSDSSTKSLPGREALSRHVPVKPVSMIYSSDYLFSDQRCLHVFSTY